MVNTPEMTPEELEAVIASHNLQPEVSGTNTPESWDGGDTEEDADDGDCDSVYNAYWAMLHR